MNALLSFVEKMLTGIFILVFGALLAVGLSRYLSGGGREDDSPWRQVKSERSVESILEFLRQCQSCPHEAEAEEALDELQRPWGLVSRLARAHLSARASISLPVFSPDGRKVLGAGGGGLDFWDTASGARLPRGENAFMTRGGRYVETLAYAADGSRVAAGMSGTEGGNLLVWDEKTGELLADYIIEGYDAEAVAFTPRGDLVGWLAHGPVGIWEPTSGKFMRATHEGASALAFLAGQGGRPFLLTASGRELWFWNPADMELVRKLEIRSDRILLGLSQDGLAIVYYEGPLLELRETGKGSLIATFEEHDGEVVSFCRDPRKGWLVVGTRAGSLYLWDPVSGKRLGRVPAHEGPIEQLACSAQGRVATVAWDSVKIWDLEKLRKGSEATSPP